MAINRAPLVTVLFGLVGAFALTQFRIEPSVAFLSGVIGCYFLLTYITKPKNTSSRQSKASAEKPTTTLYVGNLPYRAHENDVRDHFGQHGEVVAVRLMKDKRTGKRRGFGFVVMAQADANKTISALNDTDFMSRTLKVREANEARKPEQ